MRKNEKSRRIRAIYIADNPASSTRATDAKPWIRGGSACLLQAGKAVFRSQGPDAARMDFLNGPLACNFSRRLLLLFVELAIYPSP